MSVFNVAYPPLSEKFVNEKGEISESWQRFFRSAYSQMSNNFNEKGTHMPTITRGELGDNSNGTAYYNTDAHQLEVIINGAIHKIDTTPV